MGDVDSNSHGGMRQRAGRAVRVAMEGLVLVLVCLSPWALGAVEPLFEFALDVGVAVLVTLWGVRMLLAGELSWKKCPVTLCLAALFLLGLLQILPLSPEVLGRLSPATARLYEQLLPAQAEVLPAGVEREPAGQPAGSTLSLYPGRTQQEALRLLAVFLVFAAVRNNLTSVAALRRLSLVAVVNGALLALFALVQHFTSPASMVYWTWPTQGQVFGPFICRNHFPFYVNVCLGLGLGLLLSLRYPSAAQPEVRPSTATGGKSRRRRHRHGTSGQHRSSFHAPDDLPGYGSLLHDSRALWLGAALSLMLAACVFCLSRGGTLALLGGFTVWLALRLWLAPRFSQLGVTTLVLVAAFGLVAWFGFDRVEARFADLWKGETLQQARGRLWSHSLPLAWDFPLTGTGYGTFEYVEPLHRRTAEDVGIVYEHAHNDYLEAVVEGGLPRLLLSLLAIGFLFRLGYRAVSHQRGGAAGALAGGALFGLSTLVIHSFLDFGLHIPAIALLATVLCAHLSALGETEAATATPAEPDHYAFRLWGLAPVAGALMLVCLAALLPLEGWRAYQAQRYWNAALVFANSTVRADQERRLTYLEAAAWRTPESARVELELGNAHLALFTHDTESQERIARWTEATQAVLSAAPTAAAPLASPAPLASVLSWHASPVAAGLLWAPQRERPTREHLVPALQHYLQARDLCPLLPVADLQLAAHAEVLPQADPPQVYLERAKALVKDDPEFWYLCGLHECIDGHVDQAEASWRQSLTLSDRYLPEILAHCSDLVEKEAILTQVLPSKPDVLVQAALLLYPEAEDAAEQKPYLDRALELLEQQPHPLSAQDLHQQAFLQAHLEQPAAALRGYQAALAQEPQQTAWRYEYAQLLHEQGRYQEARRELQTVLDQQPGNAPAREQLDIVNREIAEKLQPSFLRAPPP